MLDAIGIISQNIDETVKFYALLGVHLSEAGGPEHWEGTTPSGVRLMIDSVKLIKELNPDWQASSGNSIALCFKQPSSNAVDQLHKTITDAGYKSVKEPWDAFWGQRYASVLDPDGNQIDIFSDL